MDRVRSARPMFHLCRQHVSRVFASAFLRGPDEGATEEGGDRDRNLSSHRVLRKFACLLSAHWFREGLQALFVISLARRNTTTYGEFMLALSLGQVLLFVAEFGLNQHLVPLLTRKDNELGDILVQVSMLKGMILACGCVGMFFFVHWQGYSHGLKMLVFVLGVGVGMEALASSFFVAFQVEGHQGLEGKIKAMGAALGFGYGLSLLFLGAAPLIVAFYKIVETAANLAGVLFTSAKRASLRFRLPRISHIWATGRGSIVLTLMAIAAILYNKANIFFLQRFGGPTNVAQYSVTWEMVDGVSTLTVTLLLKNILFPLFVKLWETDRVELARLVRNSAEWLLAAALPIMFVLFIESDRLIGLIYGPAYGDAVWMQKYLVPTIVIGFLHNLAAYLMLSMKHELLLLSFYLGGLAFNIICCVVFIPANPLLGSVLAIVLTKAVVAVATVSTCQLRFGLISKTALFHLISTAAMGAILYLLSRIYLFREASEILALLPALTLACYRWHEFNKSRRVHLC
jgi:O-antigen/teichoic acid export membrane protein